MKHFQKKKFMYLVSVFLWTQMAQATSIDIYVSPQGSDVNQGTKEKPVATFEAARDLIRRYKSIQAYPAEGFTVWVAGGEYEQKEPLVLNELDSGTSDSPITWRAVENEKVYLTGGVSLPAKAFTRVEKAVRSRLSKEAVAHVRCIDLKALGITDYGEHKQIGHALSVYPSPMELFINDEPMTLARYPNKGFVAIGAIIDGGSVPRTGDYSNRGAIFKYTDKRHEIWAKSDDVWFQGTFNNGYADDKIKVKKIDVKQKTVQLASPHMYGVGSGKEYQHYVVLNVLDELDSPGEWYLDRKTGKLYVWPTVDLAKAKIAVSMLEQPIVCLEGVSHLLFRDFVVETGRGIGLYIERGFNNTVAGCTIRNVGNTGIYFGQGAKQTVPYITHDDYEGVPQSRFVGNYSGHIYSYTTWDRHAGHNQQIRSCDIYNTGSGGIILSGGSKRTLMPGNNSIVNCKIHNLLRSF